MKIDGRCILGDLVQVDSYTSSWVAVKLHPAIFYRRIDIFHNSLDTANGLYAEIDTGDAVIIRFSNKDDLTAFYRAHHEYI